MRRHTCTPTEQTDILTQTVSLDGKGKRTAKREHGKIPGEYGNKVQGGCGKKLQGNVEKTLGGCGNILHRNAGKTPGGCGNNLQGNVQKGMWTVP